MSDSIPPGKRPKRSAISTGRGEVFPTLTGIYARRGQSTNIPQDPGTGTPDGAKATHTARRSFTHRVIRSRPAAVQNPIKGGEAQAEKTIKEAAA